MVVSLLIFVFQGVLAFPRPASPDRPPLSLAFLLLLAMVCTWGPFCSAEVSCPSSHGWAGPMESPVRSCWHTVIRRSGAATNVGQTWVPNSHSFLVRCKCVGFGAGGIRSWSLFVLRFFLGGGFVDYLVARMARFTNQWEWGVWLGVRVSIRLKLPFCYTHAG